MDEATTRFAGPVRAARVAGVLIASAALATCSGSSSEAPAPPACQTGNTADVAFRNDHARNVYQVLWDGAVIGTVPPARTGLNRAVPAGTPHTLAFRIVNTTTNACAPSSAILAQCTSTVFSCAG